MILINFSASGPANSRLFSLLILAVPFSCGQKKSIPDMFSVNQLFERLLPQSCSAVVDESYNLFKSVSKRLKKYTCRTCRIGNSSGDTHYNRTSKVSLTVFSRGLFDSFGAAACITKSISAYVLGELLSSRKFM